MIDRSLNYGRHLIEQFIADCEAPRCIVDLGAGHGDDLALAHKVAPEAELHGLENFPPYVAELEARGVRVHAVDLERDALPFDDGTVDIVIANQVLEHMKEVFWIFHEVSRVLNPGGSFVIGVPNLASLHNRLLLLLGRQPTPIQTASAHVRGFTRPDLLAFTEACFPGGYQLAGYGGGNFYPFPGAVARPLARWFPSLAWGLFLRIRKQGDYGRQFLEFPVAERLETSFFLGEARGED